MTSRVTCIGWFGCVFSPCHLEDPQQTDAAQHRDPQRRHDLQLHQDGLHDATAHHEAVETIKERHKVMGQTQTVHLQQHLHRKERQQHLVGNVCTNKDTDTENVCSTTFPTEISVSLRPVPLVEEKEAVVTLDLSQPVWLVIVLRGAEGGVEEDQQQNQPIESYGFDGSATVSATDSVPAT